MVIQVLIKINERTIYHTFCENISERLSLEYGKGQQIYKQGIIENNKIINKHKYSIKDHIFEDGSIDLAIKMLQNLKNGNEI